MHSYKDSNNSGTVFVIDEHPIVGFGLAEMIKDLSPHAKIHLFSGMREAASRAVQSPPALVITAFYMKDVQPGSFLDLFETLFPSVPVLVSNSEEAVLLELKRIRNSRCVPFSKFSSFGRLMEVLRTGLSDAGFEVLYQQSPTGAAGRNPLTPKQMEVLEHISTGLSNKSIAQVMQISTETVKGHVHDILARLKVENRMAAAFYFRQVLRPVDFKTEQLKASQDLQRP